jgi:hypothetical protein
VHAKIAQRQSMTATRIGSQSTPLRLSGAAAVACASVPQCPLRDLRPSLVAGNGASARNALSYAGHGGRFAGQPNATTGLQRSSPGRTVRLPPLPRV